MIENIPSTNHHLIRNLHMAFRIKGEDESYPLPVCPYAQGLKTNDDGLPPHHPYGQEAKGKLLEAIRGYIPIEYFIEYFVPLRSYIKLVFNTIRGALFF